MKKLFSTTQTDVLAKNILSLRGVIRGQRSLTNQCVVLEGHQASMVYHQTRKGVSMSTEEDYEVMERCIIVQLGATRG